MKRGDGWRDPVMRRGLERSGVSGAHWRDVSVRPADTPAPYSPAKERLLALQRQANNQAVGKSCWRAAKENTNIDGLFSTEDAVTTILAPEKAKSVPDRSGYAESRTTERVRLFR